MKIAGVDIGTTGCKCTVFDAVGKYLGRAYREYPANRNDNGHEIDANLILSAVFETIAEMAKQYPDIAGIGITSFGETFVMTDVQEIPCIRRCCIPIPEGRNRTCLWSMHLAVTRCRE